MPRSIDDLDPVRLERVRAEVLAYQKQVATLLVCDKATYIASLAFGGSMEFGAYTGPEAPLVPIPFEAWWSDFIAFLASGSEDYFDPAKNESAPPYYHHWLRFADGSILDASANQFGDPDPIRFIAADDPRQVNYVVDTAEDDHFGYPICRFLPVAAHMEYEAMLRQLRSSTLVA